MNLTTSLGKTLLACLTVLTGILTRSGGVPHDLRFRLYGHFTRAIRRLDSLATKWLENRLPKPRAPRPPPATPRDRTPLYPHQIPLPRRKRWVVDGQQMTALVGNLLDDLANSEAFKQLLAAAPQAGRLLRPLIQMFQHPMPEHLKLPKRPKPPKPPKPEPEPLVINPHAHVPYGLGAAITRRLRKSGFTIAPRIPKISTSW